MYSASTKNNSCRKYYSVLEDDNDEEDNNMKPKNEVATHYGMLDSGTTDHFISVQASVKNVRPKKMPSTSRSQTAIK